MNSVLNPEAPEFYPHLSSVTQDGYTKVNKTIKLSNHLPAGVSYKIFKTFTDFSIVACKMSNNVVVQTNDIVITELPAVKLKQNDVEYNTEKIIDVNDTILDRININIDNVCRGTVPGQQYVEAVKINPHAWTNKPVITKIKVGTTLFIGAKNIPRPQLSFKDPVDNSDSLWVPKISDKPNNIKPLALNILYNDEGEAVGYEHPYNLELDMYQPPKEAIEPDPEPPAFPPPLEATPLTYIDTEQQVDDLVDHLETVFELAIDVEHHSYRTYQGITCLIQISTYAGDFIIDALAVREHIHKLNLSFTDPKKIKVFHGAEMDVLWLQRDFGLYVVGMFDTHQAARVLGSPGLSLKTLLMRYCAVDADKRYQLADWRIRPLPNELIKYARMDTHYLLYIWRRMKGELLDIAAGKPQKLVSVFEASRQICGATYNKEVIDDNSHMTIYLRSKKSFNSRQMAALRLLYRWRDAQARELDESTTYLLPNHMMLSLAEALPREVQGLSACCNPMSPFLKQNLVTVHRMLLSCRELPLEPQLYQMPAAVGTMAVQPSQLSYEVLDLEQYEEVAYEDENIYYEEAEEEHTEERADVDVDLHLQVLTPTAAGSGLNVDAKMFIPPFDRYKQYRTLAQVEEIKEYKEKEAKIAAISKDNEYIKSEVLIKLQEAKTLKENDSKKTKKKENEEPAAAAASAKGAATKNAAKASSSASAGAKASAAAACPENDSQTALRKRKMSNEKGKKAEPCPAPDQGKSKPDTSKNKKNQNKAKSPSKSEQAAGVKPFNYKNMSYRKFREDSEKAHKQSKTKFKKHK